MLDIRSVIVSGLVTEVVCTAMVFMMWQEGRRRVPGLAFWLVGCGLQGVGFFVVAYESGFPSGCLGFLSHAFMLTGALLGLWGLGRTTGISRPHGFNLVLFVVFLSVHGYYTFVAPCLFARVVNVDVAMALVCAQCAWAGLRKGTPLLRETTRMVGVVSVGYTLVFTIRLVSLLVFRKREAEILNWGPVEALFLLIIQVLLILMTYGVFLMVGRRLIQTLSLQEEKYSKLFHLSPLAMALTRLSDGKLLEVNEGLERISGYSRGEMLERTTVELDLWVNTDDRKDFLGHVDQDGRILNHEFLFKRKNGEVFTGLFSGELVDINGDHCALSLISDITERRRAEAERERLVSEREKALSEVRVLSGLLPICAACKKIRDEHGQWQEMERYVHDHSQADFSHGLCPACEQRLLRDECP